MKQQSPLLDIIIDLGKERSSFVCWGMLEYAVASGLLMWGTKCGGLGLGGNGELLAQGWIWVMNSRYLCWQELEGLPGDKRTVGVLSSTSKFHAIEPGQVVLEARAGSEYNQLWELPSGACMGAGWQQAHAQRQGQWPVAGTEVKYEGSSALGSHCVLRCL